MKTAAGAVMLMVALLGAGFGCTQATGAPSPRTQALLEAASAHIRLRDTGSAPLALSDVGSRVTQADLDGDGVEDVALIFSTEAGNSATQYLAASSSRRGDQFVETVVGGSCGHVVKGLHIAAGVIEARGLEPGPDDPCCCPSRETTRAFVLEDGKLSERKSVPPGVATDGAERTPDTDVRESSVRGEARGALKNPPGVLIEEYGKPVPVDAEEVDTRCIVDSRVSRSPAGGSLANRTATVVTLICEPTPPISRPTDTSLRYMAWDFLIPLPYELRDCDIVGLRLGRSTTDTWEILDARVLEGVPLQQLSMDYTRFDSIVGPCPRWISPSQRR